MSEHYFTHQPQSARRERTWEERIRGRRYVFTTDAGVFSREGIDRGSRLLIESVPFSPHGPICDLGCGYGPIGIVAAVESPGARVHLTDVNERAVELARRNIAANGAWNARAWCGDGLAAVPEPLFAQILTNPPLRAGKEVVHGLLVEAAARLAPGGELWLVVRTQQGAKSLRRFLETLFAAVNEATKGGGYRLYRAQDPLPGLSARKEVPG